MLLGKINTLSIVIVFSSLPLMADNNVTSHSSLVPDVPNFSITYQGDALVCSPTGLIKQKTHKDLVKYKCQKVYANNQVEKKHDEVRGHNESQRLNQAAKEKMAQGAVYTVEVPLYDADSPLKARIIAERQLKNRPHGKYIRMLLPAKFYMSIRPQLVNSGDDGEIKLHDGGSRAGFFYYYQFDNDLELLFQYEAGISWNADTPFLNASDASDTNRRLSYFGLKYTDHSLILGKYWSAYYDIAGFTDQFMTYGALASGTFSAGPSGTGRADRLIQYRTEKDDYDATVQVQLRHDAFRDWNIDYSYTMAGSLIYNGWEGMKLGAAINYGKFDEITPEMQNEGVDGDDFSSIIGFTYTKNKFTGHAVLSYTKNHTVDDAGIYFDSVGSELYMRYDIDESFRVAGGGNWLFPEDNDYDGKYNINNIILSLQYTFGEKTFDDLVYMEVSFPNGKLENGDSKDTRFAIGLRYFLDY